MAANMQRTNRIRKQILRGICLLAGLSLAGCAGDPGAQLLSDIDFSDNTAVAELLAELPAAERSHLQSYMIHHLASSKAFCGEALVDETGRQPLTIGEAIRLTIARDLEIARERLPLAEQGYSELAIKQIEHDELADHLWFLQTNLEAYRAGEMGRIEQNQLQSMERDVFEAQERLDAIAGELSILRKETA